MSFDAVSAFLALKEQLCVEDYEFVSRMFREHPDRASDLMLERAGQTLSNEEFAQFSFEIATQIAHEHAM